MFGALLANKRWWRWGWRWVWSWLWLRETSTPGIQRRQHSARAVKCPRTAPWEGSLHFNIRFTFVEMQYCQQQVMGLHYIRDATWNSQCPRTELAGIGEVCWCWTEGQVATLGEQMCSPAGRLKYCHCMTWSWPQRSLWLTWCQTWSITKRIQQIIQTNLQFQLKNASYRQ